MKQNFDNAGIAQVQAVVMGLPATELTVEVNYIRTDFKAWLSERFDLRPHQEQQVDNMPTDFALRLANAIADRYEQRVPVQFYKETPTPEEDKEKDLKEIILNGVDQVTYLLGSSPSVAIPELAIWIRYKHIL